MGKIALIFSGQGAQYSGMGKALYDASPAAKAVFDLADSIREGTSAQCFEGAQEELNRTVNTQCGTVNTQIISVGTSPLL